MAENDLFSEESAERVKHILFDDTEERRVKGKAPIWRVPKLLLDINRNLYIPQVLSLGPYHYHDFKVEDASIGVSQFGERMTSTQASYKLKLESAAAVSGILRFHDQKLDQIVPMFEEKWSNFQSFYNLSDIESENSDKNSGNFALMMVLDSLFLMHFLSRRDHGERRVEIMCDILKLENQIPLFAFEEVFKFKFPRSLDLASSLELLLEKAYEQLSPFDLFHEIPPCTSSEQNYPAIEKEPEPHLLGCMHAIISPHLAIGNLGDHDPEPTLLQRISRFLDQYVVAKVCAIFFCFTRPTERNRLIKEYTAGELAMAGIKFKSFSILSSNIRLDGCSRTLYLPRMTVSPLHIEVLVCNLAALEDIDRTRRTSVTTFIHLMNCLIKTPEDVRVLRKSKVISLQSISTNEDIAEIWRRMGSSFNHNKDDFHVKRLKDALNDLLVDSYHQTKIKIKINKVKIFLRKLYDEFHERYWSKRLNVIALVVATVILVATVIQARCSLWACNSKNTK